MRALGHKTPDAAHRGVGAAMDSVRRRMRHRSTAAVVAALLAAGCAPMLSAPDDRSRTDPPVLALAERCARAYAALDLAVDAAGVRDAGSARIAGLPMLRASRLLVSLAPSAHDLPAFAVWVDALEHLDRDARQVELANLPAATTMPLRHALRELGLDALPPSALLEGCARALRERDLATEAQRARLRETAQVPDDYEDGLRVAGAYPLTALPFAIGVRRYEAATRAVFALPPDELPVQGRRVTYRPRTAPALGDEALRALLARGRSHPLRLPLPDAAERAALLAIHAPVLVVDERDGDDRIGRPHFAADDRVAVDTKAAVLFARLAHSRFGDQTLLQLVYTAWFPARRASYALDPLSGHLDALVWRVTLDGDGTPLLYDSIHGCGCYHRFFPGPRLTPRAPVETLEESALVPGILGSWTPGSRIVLHIESGTHALQQVRIERDERVPATPPAILYGLADDDALRMLPRPGGGTRSLYAPNGRVPGTERGERLLFWPMGIASAGAMRQWGRQPTAFIGRRHFDEPLLIERYFVRAPPPALPTVGARAADAPTGADGAARVGQER